MLLIQSLSCTVFTCTNSCCKFEFVEQHELTSRFSTHVFNLNQRNLPSAINNDMEFCCAFPYALDAMDFVIQFGRMKLVNGVTSTLLIVVKIVADRCD